MFPQRILLAVDGSNESHLAIDHTLQLHGHTQTEVHVVHVGLVSGWTNSRTLNDDQLGRLRSAAQEVLDEEVEVMTTAGLTPTQTYVRLGRATDEILRLRDEIEADLIVVGSRGLNAFTRVLLGSDAEGIVRHAPCPVLVVRRDK
ncbi:MAG: universal stress protein [Ornithinimicrobium sp.]